MADLRKLTQEYIVAFNTRDLDKVGSLLAEEFELTDPEVTALAPKSEVLKYIKGLFDAHDILRFEARSILVDGNLSVIHFTLRLGETILDGVDVIAWMGQKMVRMEAYLTLRK